MKVLVCGGRDYSDRDVLFYVLDCHKPTEIISGMARGADSLAAEYAVRFGIKLQKFYANWSLHGNSAGPIRNRLMLTVGKPDKVIAFKGGKGTADMIKISKAAGIEVVEIGNATNR